MAIAFLLARPDVNIEAITIVNGLAHVHEGASLVLRLLEFAGKTQIPVYEGRETPIEGSNTFPDSWRGTADALPGVDLPKTARKPETMPAAEFLAARLKAGSPPVSLLALGPLTNIAEALGKMPRGAYAIDDMVIMGGAIRVPGNVQAGNIIITENRTSEWNFYIDPKAARLVVESGLRFRLIPLDACNLVPIDLSFLVGFTKAAEIPLGKFVADVLRSSRTLINNRIYYAWDPLAAAALLDPKVVKISSVPLDVQLKAPSEGRTIETGSARNIARVALDADAALFHKIFFEALAH